VHPDRRRGGIISCIEPDSIAEDLGWCVGDEIVGINGHQLHDVIDYRFYSTDEDLRIVIRRGDETLEYELEKDFDMPLGVSFDEVLFDGIRTCGAHCIFCFVEQLPKGLRKPLYVKDDDYRLSFLDGNFVTLANVTEADLSRIVAQRLSPLYISVHTTDPELRRSMLGREGPDILAQMETLAEGRISLHTQIVLCRGINDGDHLRRSIRDLARLHPTVESIAIVPAGLSAHRRHKTPIPGIDAQYSGEILDRVKLAQRFFRAQIGTRLVWAADEFYLSAGRPVPAAMAYEGFPQIENGIGLVRKFKDSASRSLRALPERFAKPMRVSTVTGRLAYPLVREWADSIGREDLRIEVFPIANRLFGEMVTVTGLVAGRDVIDQLRGKDLGDALFIPSVCLRDGVFLDDVSVSDVESALGCRVLAVEPLPHRFVRTLVEVSEEL